MNDSPDIPAEMADLLYRRQFVLTTDSSLLLEDCPQVRIGTEYILSAHRDLEVTHIGNEVRSLTLLGFALDAERPQDSNAEILQRLADTADLHSDVIRDINTLGGRWVLIVHDKGETVVLHDACAQRQVYFTKSDSGCPLMCASEPAVIAEKLGLSMNPEAVDFVQSRGADDFEIYWMPGDTTLYEEVSALLPNHLLRLPDRRPSRYWPQVHPPEVDQARALQDCLGMLSGFMESAARRYALAIPMTAGWDSRLVLALSRMRSSAVYAFTICYPGNSATTPDIAVPARLLKRLGIPHHLIAYPETVDQAFKNLVRRNNSSANPAYCADIQALHVDYPADRVCVTGDVAEIVKRYFHGSRNISGPVSAEYLTELSRFGPHPFAVRAFSRWLEDAGQQPLDTLDLFSWEQMAGRWQGKVRSEFDIVQESFAPLNCRSLLNTMLGVDARKRSAPDYGFFREMIENLWPETLSEPINPPDKGILRRILSRIKRRFSPSKTQAPTQKHSLFPEPWTFRAPETLRLIDVRSVEELADHADAWNQLLLDSPAASPMMSYAHISAFFETQIKEHESWLCLFGYDNGQLTGVFPIIATRSAGALGFRVLFLKTPYDNMHTGSVDCLALPGHEAVIETFVDYLSKIPRAFPLVRIREIPRHSPTMVYLERPRKKIAALRFVSGAENYIEVPKQIDEFHSRLSSNFKRQLKRGMKKLQELPNVEFRCRESSRSVRENRLIFEAVEDAGWKGEENTSVKAMPENARLYQLAAGRFDAAGWMEWNFLETDGQAIGAHYAVRIKRTLYLLKIGYDERFSAASPGNLLLEKVIEHVGKSGDVDEINCVADCAWHRNWAMTGRALHDVIILPPIRILSPWLVRFVESEVCRKLIERYLIPKK